MHACGREEAAGRALALRWVGEQVQGARAALAAARAALKRLKAAERKRAQKVGASFAPAVHVVCGPGPTGRPLLQARSAERCSALP